MRIMSLFISLALLIGMLPQSTISTNAAEDPAILVTLGDSYSCGEGITPYYGGGDEKVMNNGEVNPDWLAHRSTKAWPGLLTLEGVDGVMSDHIGTTNPNWYFVASSGAVINDLANGQKKTINHESISANEATLAPQFDVFDKVNLTENDFVTVSIGGNDIGFVDILKSSISLNEEQFEQSLEALKSENNPKTKKILADLRTAYVSICEKAD